MRRVSQLVLLLSFAFGYLWPAAVRAQERKGTISGTVTDSSGGVLKGAQISLEPVGANLVSDVQGQFFINNLDPGGYTVTITYVGFASFTKSVELAANQTANVDAKLEVQSVNLQVLVTAERASGEAEAVNRQLSADNLVQVLPAEVIRSLPNANMADAIGRLPSVTLERDEGEGKYMQVRGTEPRLTNLTIDGVNTPSPESGIRQVKLDTIPADLVESVEINKTLQANMDGDGIGGSANLVTKTATERPTISLSGVGGYSPIIGGRGLTETTGTIGQRFGKSKRFGVLIGGSYDWNGRGIDDIEPVPDLAQGLAGSPRWFDSIDVREYRYYRSRWGFSGSTDYKLAEDSDIYFRFLYSDFKNYGDRWVYTLNDNTANAGTINPSPGVPTFNTQIRRPDYLVSSAVLGGHHVLSTTWYSWDVAIARSRQLERGDPTAAFTATNLASSSCAYDPTATTNTYLPQWTPACFTEAYNPANFTLTDFQTVNPGMSAQLNVQVSAAMAKRYHLGSHLSTIEFGGKFRNAHKYDDEVRLDFTPNPVIPMTLFPSRFSNGNYYNRAYNLGPNPSYGDVLAYFNANQGSFTPSSDASRDFDLIEKVSAGYIMNTIDFGRLRFIAGVRFEGTNLDTVSFDLTTNTLSDRASGSYLRVLPSASLGYAVTPDTNVRLVFSRGVSRPDPQDIAQKVSYSTGQNPFSASLGNANLKAESAYNYDLLVEHALKPFGIISGGVFYKSLGDPIVTTHALRSNFQPTPQAPVGLYDVKQPLNAGKALVGGFEAAYIQHLTFLPGLLGGLGISANYGFIASRTSGLPGRSDHPRLLRSAPHTWNISPTYDRGRVSLRLGMSYNAANIYSYQFTDGTAGGLKGPLGDTYFYPHLQIDAQGSFGLGHGLSLIAYGLNIINEVFGFYNGSSQYMIQREYYKPEVATGFRWSPREK